MSLTVNETLFIVRPAQVQDYADIRHLLPDVTRCNKTLTPDEFRDILDIPTFHAYCCIDTSTQKLVGYAELHRLPHLGRSFDGRLEKVIIDPQYRQKGLAVFLCQHIMHEAETKYQCGRVDLTVEKQVPKHIYTSKLHFEPVDTTVMRRMLAPL